MKVFISHEMRGKSDEEIKKNISKYTTLVKELYPGVEVIDSLIKTTPPENIKADNLSVWYLGQAISLLATADIHAIVGKADTELARGVALEQKISAAYGIPQEFI